MGIVNLRNAFVTQPYYDPREAAKAAAREWEDAPGLNTGHPLDAKLVATMGDGRTAEFSLVWRDGEFGGQLRMADGERTALIDWCKEEYGDGADDMSMGDIYEALDIDFYVRVETFDSKVTSK